MRFIWPYHWFYINQIYISHGVIWRDCFPGLVSKRVVAESVRRSDMLLLEYSWTLPRFDWWCIDYTDSKFVRFFRIFFWFMYARSNVHFFRWGKFLWSFDNPYNMVAMSRFELWSNERIGPVSSYYYERAVRRWYIDDAGNFAIYL